MIPFVAFSLGRAWQGFWRNWLMSLAATLTMVLMLTLLAGFFVLQNVLLASLAFVEQKVEVVAYVQDNVTQDQIDTLVARIDGMPETASVEFVSRDEALARFRETQQAQGREDLTKYLEANPLHASLNVRLTRPADLDAVTAALRQDPIVRNVLNIDALVERVVTVSTRWTSASMLSTLRTIGSSRSASVTVSRPWGEVSRTLRLAYSGLASRYFVRSSRPCASWASRNRASASSREMNSTEAVWGMASIRATRSSTWCCVALFCT